MHESDPQQFHETVEAWRSVEAGPNSTFTCETPVNRAFGPGSEGVEVESASSLHYRAGAISRAPLRGRIRLIQKGHFIESGYGFCLHAFTFLLNRPKTLAIQT